jgi:hypothetical protein
MPSGENPPPVTARVTHAPAQNSPTTCIHQNPPISTSHSLKEQGTRKPRRKETRRVVATGRTPHLNTVVASGSRTRRRRRTQLEGACRAEDGGKAQIWPSKWGKWKTRSNSTVDTPGQPFSIEHLMRKLPVRTKQHSPTGLWEKQTPTTGSNRGDKNSTTLVVGRLNPPQGKP